MNNNVVSLQQEDKSQFCPTFDDFWLLYPRRVAKKPARQIWARLTASQQLAAIVACATWRPIWEKTDPEFICHASTWLNQERWEDELPRQVTISAAAHLPAALPVNGDRGTMPDHVRALIGKLRAGK